MLKRHVPTLLILSLLLTILGCNTDDGPSYIYDPSPYDLQLPDNFPILEIPDDNPMTVEGVRLGRMLYYEPLLHKNGNEACADCHIQTHSFSSDPTVLPHINLGWNTKFLWDGKIQGTLEDIMLFEVADFFEMDPAQLQKHSEYPELFYNAFGTDQITHELTARALAQFQRTMVSAQSDFDRAIAGTIFFTDDQLNGFDLFASEEADCFHCHGGILLTDNLMHNNALDANPDPGLSQITGKPGDIGKYKTPTLRNIALTAPYMHDGRYQTLEEVIDFYSEGLEFSDTVDPLMKNVHRGGIQLTDKQKAELLAFLMMLTDDHFIQNPELSNPF
jgi:cytochrome c peroxidase